MGNLYLEFLGGKYRKTPIGLIFIFF